MNQLDIVYIGDKAVKQYDYDGRKWRFPRGEIVGVPQQLYYELIEFPAVFVSSNDAENAIKRNEEAQKALIESAESAAREEKVANASHSWKVLIDGDEVNISKYTRAKLVTAVAAEGLSIDVDNPPAIEDHSPIECLRIEVRRQLWEKFGNPALKEA